MSTSAPYHSPSGRLRATLLLPLILVLTLLLMLFFALRSGDPSRLPSPLVGKPVPDFELPGIPRLLNDYGPTPGLSSATLKGGHVSVLNVWASWCAPCVAEHPQLMEINRQGFPLYSINYKDTAEAARGFLARNGNPFRAIGADEQGFTAIDFGVYGVPETFVIDRQGRIAYRYAGPITREVLEQKVMPVIRRVARQNEGGS